MCGINGIYAFNPAAAEPRRDELLATRDHMSARGPDGSGEWWSTERRLGLGHRRLAIIDLSDRGAQPMVSSCGRYVVVFNGEIYNYPALRAALEAECAVFRSSSDTEVLLQLYAHKREAMVHDLRGMFAFAIWDELERSLFIARDPYGIKPLYTACDGWSFRFASQVKALLAGQGVSREPEPAGIVGFHLWGSVPEPFTLYRDIRALPAGCWQRVDASGPRPPVQYASIAGILADAEQSQVPAQEAPGLVRAASLDSVRAHLLADVEVGVFLSAGIDSGALLGLMKDAGKDKVKAITLRFGEFRGTAEDEAPLAAQVARHYGAEHIVRTIDAEEFRADLPALLAAMDQPSIDGVNSWFVAKHARGAGLKVALSGLGGDELLAGYPSFSDIPRWVSRARIPAAVPGAGVVSRVLLRAAGAASRHAKAPGLLEYGGTYSGAYLLRRALFLPFELTALLDPEILRIGLRRLRPLERVLATMTPAPRGAIARVAALESANYMRNQLLRDADWAGMAHSLEIRTPLVDVGLAGRLGPVLQHFRRGAGKAALAVAPTRPLPDAVVGRDKTGFGIPTGAWSASISRPVASGKLAASRGWAMQVLHTAPGGVAGR